MRDLRSELKKIEGDGYVKDLQSLVKLKELLKQIKALASALQ